MATQSLYRRYRPRRFSEVKGQEHVVRALRNAVINHREGQAYLFSGPRGTGKTTSARILAKVLNCEHPQDGEPCCECDSCLAVERGTSYDVHELDAASNNGVDAMRDLIEKASLGTPGRHKVYILDEVHMLSKAAEAALLKTLEEPPPHVVFVLATTDPQKVSDTIRSRTQHLQFHLLPMDVMESHIKWLASDAGIELDETALQSVLRQGGGSARDTVSALELVAASGGVALETTPLDEFIEAFIEHDPGRALTVVAHAVQQGRDPRTLTDDIVRHLRDCFLSLMAPELVQLPTQRAAEVADLAHRMGAASIVRAMERLGEMLVEMRHAPDPRLLLEVALVQLTHEASSVDVAVLLDRIERLEQQSVVREPTGPIPRPTPIDPTTGRAALGGRARSAPAAAPAPVAAAPAPAPAPAPPTPAAPAESAPPRDPTPAAAPRPAPTPAPAAAPAAPAASGSVTADHAAAVWASDIMPSLKGLTKAMFSTTKLLGTRDGAVVIATPNEPTSAKCLQQLGDVEAAMRKVLGGVVPILLVVDGAATADDAAPAPLEAPTAPPPPPDDEVDLSDLVDAPPETVVTPTDRLLQAFPGSQMIDE
ncbi:MAG: DNA polymerase III subunit gamma/tau [Ilumatobacteraceae bacterium]